MRLEKKNGFAILVIVLGFIFLFNGFGMITAGLSKLMGYIIPAIVMILGYYGMKSGKTFIGGTLFVIGFVILLGKLSWLIGVLFAVALIVLGFSMLKSKPKYY